MFYWDPNPEIFVIPILRFPILWYALLFTIGFSLGFPIFVSILRRFFFNDPQYIESDILHMEELTAWGKTKGAVLKALNFKIIHEEFGRISKKIKDYVEKSHCLHPKQALSRIFLDLELKDAVLGLYRKSVLITDRLVLYMLVATVIGARLGHFLFYENPKDYLTNPLEILKVWEGGLASHGAAIAILISLFLFSRRVRNVAKGLSWIRLLDFVSVPVALCGAFIRVGNFFNQEILGKATSLPWGVVFGHPADHSLSVARHPVQIYEALFYLFVFILLWQLTYRMKYLLSEGKLIGLFLVLVFGFRFLIEFLKVEQSHLLSTGPLFTMGQILSIPMICLGFYFFFKSSSSK